MIIIGLSPMAGYTDSAFRQLVREIYPEVTLVTELVSADGLKYASKRTEEMIVHSINERPLAVQLFGKHPNFFAEAAKICEHYGASSIDINMGCPAKKVIHSGHGSSLIKSPDLAYEIVEKTTKATKLPVSVKTRLGWDVSEGEEQLTENLITFCKGLQDVGAYQIVIHGRTVKQGYSGYANWKPIYELKKALSIPVIGNGDIKSHTDALDKIGNLDGIFIGRASIGDPWIFKRVVQAFKGETVDQFPDWPERKKWAIRHIRLNVETKGEKKGMLEMRKHLAFYVKGLPEARQLRNKLVRVETEGEALGILREVG